MERELYQETCCQLQRIPVIRNRRQTYTSHEIVRVLLWAAVHDRPISWACQRAHWPRERRWNVLPSQSQMSRRLRTFAVQLVLQQLQQALRDRLPHTWIKYLDGKPLPVGGCSKDRDAKFGRGAGGIQRGYKMVCAVDRDGALDAWRLGSMNVPEHEQARSLLREMPWCMYVVGDNAYDKNALYEEAGRRQMRLIGEFKTHAKAPGHRRHSAERLRSLDLQKRPMGQDLLRMRTGIERSYGNLSSFGGGLGPLPAWVRRPHRVATWVAAKLILDSARRVLLRRRHEKLHA